MKESEARKKACPQLLAAAIANGKINSEQKEKLCCCMGSACAVWEEEEKYEEIEKEIKPIMNGYATGAYQEYAPEGFKFRNIKNDKVKNKDNVIAVFVGMVESDSGECGLKTKELYCEGYNQ